MDFDDHTEFGDDDSGLIERRILEYMRGNHPEYLLPGSHVTQDFIKIVIYGDFLEKTVGVPVVPGNTTDITDDEIEEVLGRLPSEVILNPVSLETIDLIIEESFLVQEERHLKDAVDSPCSTAADFSYRAYARAEFERLEEAVEDYQMAYNLEPANYSHLIEKAQLLLDMGVNDAALGDAKYVCDRLMSAAKTDDCVEDLVRVSDIFRQCGQLKLAASCIVMVVNALRAVTWHTKENIKRTRSRDWFESETPDIGFTVGLLLSFIEDVEFEYQHSDQYSDMIKYMKSEIDTLRAVVGGER
jgi:tetratricopeptide (TPR) repeat protein